MYNDELIKGFKMDTETSEFYKKHTGEKKKEFKQEIRKICEERHIENLVHFTPVFNLKSILKKGLLIPSELDEQEIEHIKNDKERLDDKDLICLSVSFPNYKMFFRYREMPENKNIVWTVILLDPKILEDKYCAFFKKNAASSRFAGKPAFPYMAYQVFRGMFDEWGNDKWTREQMKIKPYETTNPQAEIHVLEKIETKYIKKVITEPGEIDFVKEYLDNKYDDIIFDGNDVVYSSNPYKRTTYFMPRHDWKSWKME